MLLPPLTVEQEGARPRHLGAWGAVPAAAEQGVMLFPLLVYCKFFFFFSLQKWVFLGFGTVIVAKLCGGRSGVMGGGGVGLIVPVACLSATWGQVS